jgi:NADPH-dependent 2,4-dienoyl-CoA reductase/sulfur reductase-like enzyme
LLLGATVASARGGDRVEELQLGDGRVIACDTVVVGVGVDPAAGWLSGSGLDPAGVATDVGGWTGLPHVYAAGDVSRPFDPRLSRHVRTEHWDAAARQGAAVAASIVGDRPALPVLPSFWSDLHGLRIQYVGHAEDADGASVDGNLDDCDFIVTYTRRGRPVAALAVGRSRQLVAVRRQIERTPVTGHTTKELAA